MSMYGNTLYPPEHRAQMQAPFNAAMQQLQNQYQQQVQQLYQQYSNPQQQPQAQQQAPQPPAGLSVLIVSSVDEARAYRVDPMGAMTVFADTSNNCFYTKKITNDGTAEFHTFRLDDTPPPMPQAAQYADAQTVEVLAGEIYRLRAQIEAMTEREGSSIDGNANIEYPAANTNGKGKPKPTANATAADGQ